MKHNLKINFTTQFPWSIAATINGDPVSIINQQLNSEFDLLDNNCLEIKFSGKDATVYPDMTLHIDNCMFDYLDLTPVLYSAVYYTDHPEYPTITPCTDINLNGTWTLNFNKNIVQQILTQYLGTTNE